MLSIRKLYKSYSEVEVLFGVSFDIVPGAIVGLIGENGAGKSTLIKCINGLEKFQSGEILFFGKSIKFNNTSEAIAEGIVTVPQEFNLIDELSISENVFLGRESRHLGLLQKKEMRVRTEELLTQLHSDLNPDTLIENLGVGDKQIVELARALSVECKLLIMDEPTTVLNRQEIDLLFSIIRKLASHGVSILFVSHKLDEVQEICDQIVVLRDGEKVGESATSEVQPNDMARMMVGRELSRKFPDKKEHDSNEMIALDVQGLSVKGLLEEINFKLHCGEILGVAGLGGSGRTELGETIYGLRSHNDGSIELAGKKVHLKSPSDAVEHGVILLPEDRQGAGVLLDFSVEENITLSALSKLFLNRRYDRERAEFYIDKFNIRTKSPDNLVRFLSGGNQQKVAISKGLETKPKIFIFDEPTRGVDVGARSEIYNFIRELSDIGVACLLISSDLEEIIGMCNRTLVMRDGELAGILTGEEVNEESIMYLATGVK